MNAKATETGQPTQATCWCGAIVHATTRACPCGGGFTVTEHENCGMVISGAHAQSCTYIADNIDTCATCGRDTEHCGGNSIFSNQQEPSRCRTPARA